MKTPPIIKACAHSGRVAKNNVLRTKGGEQVGRPIGQGFHIHRTFFEWPFFDLLLVLSGIEAREIL
jgi:hypothetical protein